MTSVGKLRPHQLQLSHPTNRHRLHSDRVNEDFTSHQCEPTARTSFCSFGTVQPNGATAHGHSTASSKRTPPPVPPRSPKTPTPALITTATRSFTLSKNPSIEGNAHHGHAPVKKKIPPPVPKKPSHLQLSPQRQPQHILDRNSSEQRTPARLFALLLSPSPYRETRASAEEADNSRAVVRARDSCAVFRSNPNLETCLDDDNNRKCQQLDNNNNVNGERELPDQPDLRRRSGRRKSLPLSVKNVSPTTPKTVVGDSCQWDGVSVNASSFGAHHGSASASSSPGPPSPPPIPKKDYGQYSWSHGRHNLNIVTSTSRQENFSSTCDRQQDKMESSDEVDSVVFFSTVSTVSSSGAVLLGNRNSEKLDITTGRNSGRHGGRERGITGKPNVALDAFVLEQSRRTVSIIERNARIIKWLYGCSKG